MKKALSVVVLLLVAAAGTAQVPAPSFGTSSLSVLVIDAYSMSEPKSGTGWQRAANGNRYTTTENANFLGPIVLPDGAQIVSFELEGCDASPIGGVFAGLFRMDPSGPTILGLADSGNGPAPGCGRFFHALAAVETVDNAAFRYQIEAGNGSGTGSTSIGAVRVFYRLQVSPAPVTATFGDVPTGHPFFQFVEALAESGITAGCGGGNYCPDNPVTRGQMAVFLAKALGLHFPASPAP